MCWFGEVVGWGEAVGVGFPGPVRVEACLGDVQDPLHEPRYLGNLASRDPKAQPARIVTRAGTEYTPVLRRVSRSRLGCGSVRVIHL